MNNKGMLKKRKMEKQERKYNKARKQAAKWLQQAVTYQ
jgi:hypothetical protein